MSEKPKVKMTDRVSCHHVQWGPLLDEDGAVIYTSGGQIKHWVCSCGVIVPDPPDPYPGSIDLIVEEIMRAVREVIATPVGPNESKAMTEMRRRLKAALDEYDASEKKP